MKIEFLSKTKINDDFLAQVINQLKQSREGKWSSEEGEILDKLIKDLEFQKINRKPNLDNSTHFILQENEYNYLVQNEKSSWANYLIFRYKFKIYPAIKRLTSFPTHLLVEPVSYCNLKCTMCFQSDQTFTKPPHMGYMDTELFKKIIDEAVEENCKALTMASRGEPLLHPQFSELLKYTKGKFFDLKLNTNAMLLDEEKSHQILENEMTELVFSVDSAEKDEYERIRRHGKFEKVLSNIKQFHEIRKQEYPETKCRTRVSGVKYSPNFDTKFFVEFWGKLVDNVTQVPMLKRWDSYQNSPLNKLFPCSLLWDRIYIWFDGTVNTCDYDYKSFLNIGNIKKTSIKDIWLGEKYTKFRKDHLEGKRPSHIPCDRCEN
ncbi:MAG TPA: radical SAM protein [Candidatus Parcubacteria bacterium]|nr:radical SAM protein [Candidatus Parcubacteria bacterium]